MTDSAAPPSIRSFILENYLEKTSELKTDAKGSYALKNLIGRPKTCRRHGEHKCSVASLFKRRGSGGGSVSRSCRGSCPRWAGPCRGRTAGAP